MPGLGDILAAAMGPYLETALEEEVRSRLPIGRQTPVSGVRSGTRPIANPSRVVDYTPGTAGIPRRAGDPNLPPGWVNPDTNFPNTPLPPTGTPPPGDKGTPSPAPPGGTPRTPIGAQPPISVGDINDRIARLIRDQVIPKSIRDTEGDQGYNKGFQRKAPTGEDLGFSTLQDLISGGGQGMQDLIGSYLNSFTDPYATDQPPAYDKGFAQPGQQPAAGGAPPPAQGFTPADKGQPAASPDPNQATGGAAGLPTASYYDPIFGNTPGSLTPQDVGVAPTSVPYQDPNSMWGMTGGGGGYQMGQLGPASTEQGMPNPFGTGSGGSTLSSADMAQGMYGPLFDFLQSYLNPQQTTTTPTTPTTPPADQPTEEQPPPEEEQQQQQPETPSPDPAQQYANQGNIGNSAPLADTTGRGVWSDAQNPYYKYGLDPSGTASNYELGNYESWRQYMSREFPWMEDKSIQWGGGTGSQGWLPAGYVPQSPEYYQSAYGGKVGGTSVQDPRTGRWMVVGGHELAPWEYKYAQENWTQNYDPNQPGYINTRSPGGTLPTPNPPTQQPPQQPAPTQPPQQPAPTQPPAAPGTKGLRRR